MGQKITFTLVLVAILFLFKSNCYAQVRPTIAWDKTIGGNGSDVLTAIIQTSDGGYLCGGHSDSGISGDKSQVSGGNNDYWVVKLDANGNKIWDKTFGAISWDYLNAVIQTSDGGYLLGGHSSYGFSGQEYWVIKLDASGNKLWDKLFVGAFSYDNFQPLQQTRDGGFIFGGHSASGANIAGKGKSDYWVFKVDANGNLMWSRNYGGNDDDILHSIGQTADGGYILGGISKSPVSFDKSQPCIGGFDYWIVKIDSKGNKKWDKTFGGTDTESRGEARQTLDGGYILGGSSNSGAGGDKSQPYYSTAWHPDFWVLKLDATGNKVWDKTIGFYSIENFCDVLQTADGGYLKGGTSDSPVGGDKTQPRVGVFDYWLVKLDSLGNRSWDKTIGGLDSEMASALIKTTDGGYVIAGSSVSGISGDKAGPSKGGDDFWIVKLNAPCASISTSLKTSCYAGNKVEVFADFIGLQANENGFLPWTLTYTENGISKTATGSTNSFSLSSNALPGTVYSLVSIVSGTCSVNLNGTLTVQPIPVAPTVNPGSNCGPGSVILSANRAPTGGGYVWYNSATGGTSLHSSPGGTYTTQVLDSTTTFYVAAVSNSGCESPRTSVTATIKTLPVNAGPDETICPTAMPIQFAGFSPLGGTWTGPGVSPSGLFTHNQSLAGVQTLIYTVEQDSCVFTATKRVNVLKPVSLGADLETCGGEEINLKPENASGTLRWSNGSTENSLKVKETGKYWVQHTINNCSTTDTIQVTFRNCPPPTLPNLITPNHDGQNDTFKPQYLPAGKWHLQIYNRWGVRIYETEDYLNNWPKTKVSNGTYYYRLSNPETGQKFKGWLEVVH